MERYEPRPIDTSAVKLPDEVSQLLEKLAENTHEVWALERILQGWSHGPRRDDAARNHPCLVPYAQLSEAEKDLDRQTVIQTLKLITALGYRIVPAAGP